MIEVMAMKRAICVCLLSSIVLTGCVSKADYEQLVKELFNGERTVSNDTAALPTVSNIKVEDQGNIK